MKKRTIISFVIFQFSLLVISAGCSSPFVEDVTLDDLTGFDTLHVDMSFEFERLEGRKPGEPRLRVHGITSQTIYVMDSVIDEIRLDAIEDLSESGRMRIALLAW